MSITGATTKVVTLKEALSQAEENATVERTEREKQEARVAEVQCYLLSTALDFPEEESMM